MRDWLKAFVHNAIVHPMMMVLPEPLATALHDRNADWAFGLERYDEMGLEHPRHEIVECPVRGGDVETEEGCTIISNELEEAIVRSRCIMRNEVVVSAHLLRRLLADAGQIVVDASDPMGWIVQDVRDFDAPN